MLAALAWFGSIVLFIVGIWLIEVAHETVGGPAPRSTERERKNQLGWWCVYGAVFFGFGGKVLWDLNLGSDVLLLGTRWLGAALMTAGAIGGSRLVVVRLMHRAQARTGAAELGRRPSLWRLLMCALIVAVGLEVQRVPLFRDHGAWAAVPSTVLIGLYGHLPDGAKADLQRRWGTHYQRVMWDTPPTEELWGWQRAWLRHKLIARLDGPPNLTQLSAARGLLAGRDNPTATAVCRYALRCLVSGDAQTQAEASDTVGRFLPGKNEWGQIGPPCIEERRVDLAPQLLRLVDQGTQRVGWVAIDCLGYCGEAAAPAIPRLTQIAFEESDWMRGYAAYKALRNLGADRATPMRAMMDRMSGDDRQLRIETMRRLAKLSYLGEGTSSTLYKRMEQGDDEEAEAAAITLGNVEFSDRETLACKLVAQLDTRKTHRGGYLQELRNGCVSKCLPRLVTAVSDRDADVRMHAVRLLGESATGMTPRATLESWRETILPATRDADERVREAAEKSVRQIEFQMPVIGGTTDR